MDTFQTTPITIVVNVAVSFWIIRLAVPWARARKRPPEQLIMDTAQRAVICTSLLLTCLIVYGSYTVQFAVAVLFTTIFTYNTRMNRLERELRELQGREIPLHLQSQASPNEIYAGIGYAVVATLLNLYTLGYLHSFTDIVLHLFPVTM